MRRPVRRSGTCARRRGAGHAPDRRRGGRPGRRRRPRPAPGLQHPPDRASPARRGRRRTAGPGPGAAGPDRPAADRDDRPAVRRGRVRRRVLEHPPVQRHGAGGLRDDAVGAARRVGRRDPSTATGGALLLRLPFRRPLDRTACSVTWPPPRYRAWRRSSARPTGGRFGSRTGSGSWPSRRPGTTSTAGSASRTCATCAARPSRRCRRLLDLDADPVAVSTRSWPVTVTLPPLCDRLPAGACRARWTATRWRCASCSASRCPPLRPGRSPPGWCGRYGEPVAGSRRRPDAPVPDARRRWPIGRPGDALGDARGSPAAPRGARRRAGRRDGGARCRRRPRSVARERLAEVPGIGPWTVEMVALRALGDPDAFPATDLGVRAGARALGLDDAARRSSGTPNGGARGGPTRSSTSGPRPTIP